jgi:hypothetical protein
MEGRCNGWKNDGRGIGHGAEHGSSSPECALAGRTPRTAPPAHPQAREPGKFWSRFGVTQSSGSRFETGVVIPPPVAILLRLYANGTLKDEDLHG